MVGGWGFTDLLILSGMSEVVANNQWHDVRVDWCKWSTKGVYFAKTFDVQRVVPAKVFFCLAFLGESQAWSVETVSLYLRNLFSDSRWREKHFRSFMWNGLLSKWKYMESSCRMHMRARWISNWAWCWEATRNWAAKSAWASVFIGQVDGPFLRRYDHNNV